MIDLKNKVVVITGATSGFGACLANDFVDKGSKVISLSKTDPENINPYITYTGCDITDKEKVFNEVKNIVEKFGTIDIFVNNAGIWFPHSSVEEQTKENIQKMLEVNLFGTIYCIQAVLPLFKNKNYGYFLNIISVRALEGKVGSSGYGSTKAAQNGFIMCLKEELKDTNIKVINAYPGAMKTNLFDGNKPEEFDSYMDPAEVSQKIISFFEEEKGDEIIIKRN
ncbi:MAG: SDR family oxidoreductase [bacterium]